MYADLKTMVLEAVNSTYICELHNVLTGYMGLLKKYIMNRLMARYRPIMAAEIEMKKRTPQEPLNMSQPIDMFFNIIDDGLQYSSETTLRSHRHKF